ncbi:unnamed protein product [Pleuronectes platessa]|uniref:Uncharacterized protein n=1 Tax=Pleuronectes platessa TaxID=8262 RepID=A0A9N7TH37_PLEPL|nr:unnamed protein product [Pleuronectes platessa]
MLIPELDLGTSLNIRDDRKILQYNCATERFVHSGSVADQNSLILESEETWGTLSRSRPPQEPDFLPEESRGRSLVRRRWKGSKDSKTPTVTNTVQTDRQAGRQTGRDRQTDRQT